MEPAPDVNPVQEDGALFVGADGDVDRTIGLTSARGQGNGDGDGIQRMPHRARPVVGATLGGDVDGLDVLSHHRQVRRRRQPVSVGARGIAHENLYASHVRDSGARDRKRDVGEA